MMLIIISFYNHSELIKEELFYRSEHLQRPPLDRPIEFMNIYYCYIIVIIFIYIKSNNSVRKTFCFIFDKALELHCNFNSVI